ncbi:MAG: N-acetylmuramoyl-L-alanine amidase [Bacilli bacterium]|nr:N-acetylmuramoyl-L-alanine amidase [Bacilli bacterium]
MLIVGIFLFDIVKADNGSLYGKCIYLDPGHGGLDPGATYAGVKEEDINLEIAFKLKGELESKGAVVYLTREGDYDLAPKGSKQRKRDDLYRRSVLINNSGCDMYLSLHLNATTSTSWTGAQVFYDDINDMNIKLAEILQKQLRTDLKTTRKYKEVTNGYLYKRVKVPGVLVEMGFLSNPGERSRLKTDNYQRLIAKSIAKGIEVYFKKY